MAASITTIDEYLDGFPPEVRQALQTIREVAHAAAPGAEEAIKYSMPTLVLKGQSVVHFAGWKKHISLYPEPSRGGVLGDEVDQYRSSGRGTLQFPLKDPIPYDLIGRIVGQLVAERTQRGS